MWSWQGSKIPAAGETGPALAPVLQPDGAQLQHCLPAVLPVLSGSKTLLAWEMQKPPVPQFLLLSNSVIASSWGCYIRGEWSGETRGRNMLLAFILHFLVLNLLLEKLGCFHPS